MSQSLTGLAHSIRDRRRVVVDAGAVRDLKGWSFEAVRVVGLVVAAHGRVVAALRSPLNGDRRRSAVPAPRGRGWATSGRVEGLMC